MTSGPHQLTAELVAEWRKSAACAGYHHSLFFPPQDAEPQWINRAKEVCSACPVTDECLEYAFETNQRVGIWGRTTEEERKSLRRKWLAARRRAS